MSKPLFPVDPSFAEYPRVLNMKQKSQLENPPNGDPGVYIGRGSPYGNPFPIQDYNDPKERDRVCDQFERWLDENPMLRARIRTELKGRNLLCFCNPKRCHGDTILRIANENSS